jgi:hypothetical protein
MSDYQTELGSRGRAWRAVFYQRKKEQDLKKKLGLLTPQEQQLAISAAQSAPAQASQPEQSATGSGEMMGLSTLQFNRNRKAILKTLDDLASKSISEAAARVFLSSIGMSQANVDALITDASDGTIDTQVAEEVQ